MTAIPAEVRRAQPSLADRIAARALALAVDPTISNQTVADALIRLARGNPAALDRALRRVVLRSAEHPSQLTAGAVGSLRLALDRLAPTPGTAVSREPVNS